ncbi:MAG TPA: putative metallopeptidase [Candidatus Paceibacterota bacterium]|nr:putative metallopeptidase [Candidatus Paceibacterota bacterium]
MAIKYQFDSELQIRAEEISKVLFPHVKLDRVKCFRSKGSGARRTIARCHTIGKLMQKTIGCEAHYALEFISERFDKMSYEEQTKVIIHELMHIPFSFGGGFKHHDWVCDKNINVMYKQFLNSKSNLNNSNFTNTFNNENRNKSWW